MRVGEHVGVSIDFGDGVHVDGVCAGVDGVSVDFGAGVYFAVMLMNDNVVEVGAGVCVCLLVTVLVCVCDGVDGGVCRW